MTKIQDLFKPMTLPQGANIDSRYWTDNGDGTYTPTPLMVHNIARDAVEYFKDRLVELDTDEQEVYTQYGNKLVKVGNYHYRDTDVYIVDDHENKVLSREYELKYGDALKEVDKKWKDYQKQHPDEFDVSPRRSPAMGDRDEQSYFNGFRPEGFALNLGDAVAACSAAMNLLEKFSMDATEEDFKIPSFEVDVYRSKPEFKEKHREFRQGLVNDAGIPEKVQIPEDALPKVLGDSEAKFFSKSYAKTTKNPKPGAVTIPNFNEKIMKTPGNEEIFGEFADQLITFITTTSKEQWLKSLGDRIKTIGEEFAQKFNDTSKLFKAVEDTNGYTIFRKDDENGPQKIITMTEFPDRIDCLLNADIDGLLVQFNGIVNNYGDFKKVIRLFARCLETSGAKDQSDDLLTVADAL